MSLVLDKYDALEEEQNLKYFSMAFGTSQFLGALAVILVAVWMGNYDAGGGFGWTGSTGHDKQFHYHPLLMCIGFIFLYGEAILVYRLFRHEKKSFSKFLHVLLLSIVLLFTVIGLDAVFKAHNKASHPNMFTLHSWVGIGTVLLFSCQFTAGVVMFLFPGMSYPMRTWYMPIHRFFGITMFGMGTATALMGISERAAWQSAKFIGKNATANEFANGWSSFSAHGTIINMLGLCILLYALLVIYLVANPRFQRKPLLEEQSLAAMAETQD